MPDLTKLIPWLQGYPIWLQSLVAIWMLFTVVVVWMLLFTPRMSVRVVPQPPSATDVNRDGNRQTTVEQTTKGNNSPAVAVGEGDVDITIDQRPHQK